MRTKDILEAMSSGAILRCGYLDGAKTYWLEPRSVVIPSDTAESIVKLPGVEQSMVDGMRGGPQTWRMVGGAKKGKGMERKK